MPKNASHRRKSLEQQSRENEYYRIRSRIQRRLSAYRVKGYDVSSINVPSIPKRITEGSISRLSKITTEYIRKHSRVVLAADIKTGEATKTVSGEKFYKERQKEARRKAVETRKRKKFSGDYVNAPHIGELMYEKIVGFIEQYNMQGSSFGNIIQSWLDDAKDIGYIDRLAQLTTYQLNDLEQDIRYASQGRMPKYYGVNALHWALTNKNLTAEEWRALQEAYDADTGADKFDAESAHVDPDDDDY